MHTHKIEEWDLRITDNTYWYNRQKNKKNSGVEWNFIG